MTRTLLIAAILACVGCAPAVRYGACISSTECPEGTLCERVDTDAAQCTVACHWDRTNCLDGLCVDGPVSGSPGVSTSYCRMPCDAAQECPPGLACMRADAVGIAGVAGMWCM